MLEILPIMLALCLMLSATYYAQNYAGIIGASLGPASYQYRFNFSQYIATIVPPSQYT